MNRYLLAGFFLVLAGYGALKAWPLVAGPSLSVSAPADFATAPDSMVTVTGSVRRTTALSLNGAPLLPDQDGTFRKTLAFAKGASILTFVAADRFGRTVTTTRTIFVP